MRKFLYIFRCFYGRSLNNSKWRKFLQVFLVLILVAFTYTYLQEKYAKEAVIDAALGSGRVEQLVRPDNDTLLINGALTSPGSKEKNINPFIVIAVTSSPGNVYRRNIIRNTWANKAYEMHGAVVIFFMGKPNSPKEMTNLIQEAEQYGDLIVDNFQENYYALSVKTLRIFKYFKFHHPKSRFLVKTDDDVYVNVRNLVHYCYRKNHEYDVKSQQLQDNHSFIIPLYFIAGVIHEDRAPHTWNSFSKWYSPARVWNKVYKQVITAKQLVQPTPGIISKNGMIAQENDESAYGVNAILENKYPPYAEGNFYVISSDAVVEILEVSKNVPLYHLEDVYVTGVLGTWILGIKKEGMPFISSASNFFPEFSFWWYTKFVSSVKELIAFHCDNKVDLITSIFRETVK